MVTVTSRFSCLLLLKVVPCSLAKQRKAQVQELTSFPPDQEGRANLTVLEYNFFILMLSQVTILIMQQQHSADATMKARRD